MLIKPELKLGYAELAIATTLSHTCTKPTVSGSFYSQSNCNYCLFTLSNATNAFNAPTK